MPAWLIQVVVSLAIRLGLPWVIKKWPGMPHPIIDLIQKMIDALNDTPDAEEKKLVKRRTKKAVRDYCSGVACPTDLKKE